MKYPIWKKFIVLINGRAKLRMGQYSNGNPAQFYLAYCHTHGYYEDSLHRQRGYMICPGCWKEQEKNRCPYKI